MGITPPIEDQIRDRYRDKLKEGKNKAVAAQEIYDLVQEEIVRVNLEDKKK
jgi:hypothetical protein